jgi:His/Glu/Gln/Arg/opine family amino acid ABC transporter permease subunit
MFGGYFFFWVPVWNALPQLLAGTLVALEVAVLSIGIGFVVGVVGGLCRRSSNRVMATMALVWVELIRNSPSLVKMYFLYFGLPSLGLYPSSILAGVIALVLQNGAYMTEIFRGGLESVPDSQVQAARSLGMGRWLTFRMVVLPQAFRNALPALGNNWVEVVKDTSITSAIAVPELFYAVTTLISETQRSFEFLTFAALIYLVLTTVLSGSLKLVESRSKYRR